MDRSRSKLSDGALIAQAHTHYLQGLVSTAGLLADLAEIEARRIHIAMGFSSMRAWCIGELKMTDAAILDRIQAARTAREHPVIFPMLADGRLCLASVLLLSPYLTTGNAGELLAGAAGRSKPELVEWLAHRFPTSESLPMVTTAVPASDGTATGPSVARTTTGKCANSVVPGRVNWHMATVTPVAAQRHRVEFMVADAQLDLLRQVQDLRGSDDLALVIFEALALLKVNLEQRKCGKTARPQRVPRSRRPGGRLIPAAVRRMVWERDGRQCTFVGEKGHRCEARRGLECDHVVPVARGGESTISNVRLLCRVHNQFEAERVFGQEFIASKRASARASARDTSDDRAGAGPNQAVAAGLEGAAMAEAQADGLALAEAQAHVDAEALDMARAGEQMLDVVAALKSLGYRVERARWAAEAARTSGATLEQHIRAALKLLRIRTVAA